MAAVINKCREREIWGATGRARATGQAAIRQNGDRNGKSRRDFARVLSAQMAALGRRATMYWRNVHRARTGTHGAEGRQRSVSPSAHASIHCAGLTCLPPGLHRQRPVAEQY